MNNPLTFVRAHPRSFFVACAIAGFGVSRVPFLYESNGNLAIGPYLGTWVLLGLVVGMLAPDRPWRWAVAMVIAAPLVNLARVVVGRGEAIVAMGRGGAFFFQLVTLPLLLLTAAPIMAAAYLGRFFLGYRSAPPSSQSASSATSTSGSQFKQFVGASVLCGVVSIVVPTSQVLAAWALSTAACSALFTARLRTRPFRSTMLSVAGAVAGFVILVIHDSVRGGPDHNLLPFELMFVLIITFSVGGVSALLASRLQRRGVV